MLLKNILQVCFLMKSETKIYFEKVFLLLLYSNNWINFVVVVFEDLKHKRPGKMDPRIFDLRVSGVT